MRHGVNPVIAVVGGDDDVQQAALSGFLKLDNTRDLSQLGHSLGLAGLKQFLDSRKALRDIAAGQTAGMERTHRQLLSLIHICVGGVVGRMDLGLVTACQNYGDAESTGGGYVGGVAGTASSTVRACYENALFPAGTM